VTVLPPSLSSALLTAPKTYPSAPNYSLVETADGLRILLDAGSSGPQGWSSRERQLRCPKRGGLAKAGIPSSRTSDPLVKGSLVHIGLAHYYARVQADQQGWSGDAEATAVRLAPKPT